MNDIWTAYLNMFQKKQNIKYTNNKKSLIINEDADDDQDDQDQTDDDQQDDSDQDQDDEFEQDQTDDDQQTDDDSEQDDDQSVSDKEEQQKKGADLKFSADLAAEFGNTCNTFTNLAASVVKKRTVDKNTADQLNKIIEKLKSLIQAASDSI